MDVWMTAALGGRCCSVGSVISNIHHGRRNRSDCNNNAKRAVASNRAVLNMPQSEAEGEAEQLTKKRANHGASTIVRFEASNSDWKASTLRASMRSTTLTLGCHLISSLARSRCA